MGGGSKVSTRTTNQTSGGYIGSGPAGLLSGESSGARKKVGTSVEYRKVVRGEPSNRREGQQLYRVAAKRNKGP